MADKHPKRPRDPAQLAKLMIDIASGEVEDRQQSKRPRRTAPRQNQSKKKIKQH